MYVGFVLAKRARAVQASNLKPVQVKMGGIGLIEEAIDLRSVGLRPFMFLKKFSQP
jgi:hypothetical protein